MEAAEVICWLALQPACLSSNCSCPQKPPCTWLVDRHFCKAVPENHGREAGHLAGELALSQEGVFGLKMDCLGLC